MRSRLLVLLAALIACAVGGPLKAANLLVNGDFETTSFFYINGMGQPVYPGTSWGPYFKNDDNSVAQTVQGWENYGYNFIFNDYMAPSAAGTPTSVENLLLWGMPTTGVSNGIGPSPTGGNFLAADGAYLNAPVTQTVSGLTVGRQYSVSFWWAAGQLHPYTGATTDRWDICFGTCSFTTDYNVIGDGYATYDNLPGDEIHSTSTVVVPEFGFVPWRHEYIVFTATSSTQTLSLLAYGTPLGTPPFALIDGLSLDAVPEPSTWAMMLIGFGVVGSVMRTRRRSLGSDRALRSQII